MSRVLPSLLLLLTACTPKTPPAPPVPTGLDLRPEIPDTPAFSAPLADTHELSNGADLWIAVQPTLPLVSVRLVVPGGSSTDPADHPGLSTLADQMLLRGAGDLDATAFATSAAQAAIDIDVSTGATGTTLSVDCHRDQLDAALGLLAMAVLQPRFDPDEVQRATEQHIGDLAVRGDDPYSISSDAMRALVYGAGHPLAHPPVGTAAGVADLTASDLAASWAERSHPGAATFVVTGAVRKDVLAQMLNNHFGGWAGTEAPPDWTVPPPAGWPAAGAGPTWHLVDMPDSSQSVLTVVMPGWAASDPAFPAARLGGIVLGGTFTSRLNRLLREEKGYTYGARARVEGMKGHGLTRAYTAVRGDVTAEALVDLMGELEKAPQGIDAAELKKAIGARQTEVIDQLSSRSDIADMLVGLVMSGGGSDGLRTDLNASNAASEADVDAAMALLDPSRAIVVVVGDASKVTEPLQAAFPHNWQTQPSASD